MNLGMPGSIRPTVMDVDLDALGRNFARIQKHVAPAEVMPIMKANGYGHGLVPCARVLEEAGARRFGVAFLEEGILLRRAGIRADILALGGVSGTQIDDFLDYNIEITASSVWKLQRIEECAKSRGVRARVQLKIDTGMERIGMHHYTAETLLEAAGKCTASDVVGLFSHFATAEQENLEFAHIQRARFEECLAYYDRTGIIPPLRHMSNSGAILQLPEARFDAVRPGLLLYGISPAAHLSPAVAALGLERVMSLRSEVVYFKVVQPGAGVSYDLTWTAPHQTRVVTVPIGYGDGYARRLSNRGSVLIRGKRYPIVGKVCMDQTMIDIGPEGVAYNGDEVVLLGRQGDEEITVEELSRLVETDPRDILCATNQRIPRRYSSKGDTFIEGLP